MFESMRVTNQIVPKRQMLQRKKEDEDKKQTTEAENNQGGNTNLAQSRGLQYVEDLQSGKKPTKPVQTNFSNNYAYNTQVQSARTGGMMHRPMGSDVVQRGVAPGAMMNRASAPSQVSPMGGSSMKKISPKINIAQVIGDFKNTAHAIGTPEETFKAVNEYLDAVTQHTQNDGANVKLVQSNLKSAALLLDKYISETLNKDSKVVENWVEAIFLQQVDYKYNEHDINEAFLVKMPEDKDQPQPQQAPAPQAAPEPAPEPIAEAPVKKGMDEELKKLFSNAKKEAKIGNGDSAISAFFKAIQRAQRVDDKNSESKIYYEMGKIYDKKDDLKTALKYYNNAIETTEDQNVKVQSHYAMAQIYDDVNQFTPAIDHYMAAVSFAGQTDNFKAQIKSLTKIGNIFADKYDKEAFNVYDDAKVVAEESKDSSVKGFVSSTIADAYDRFNNPSNALKYYSDAVQHYVSAGQDEKVAMNYKKAGELMQDYSHFDKGKNLIQKAIMYAKKANNENLVKELQEELAA